MDEVPCPGCGLILASAVDTVDERFNASTACLALYHDVLYFTLGLRDPEFLHQAAVDAYAAQHDGPQVRPVTAMFALVQKLVSPKNRVRVLPPIQIVPSSSRVT